jgi:hypothetical protein
MRTSLVCSLVALLAVTAVGCSADTTPTGVPAKAKTPPVVTDPTTDPPVNDAPTPKTPDPAPTPGTEIGSETWKTGKQIPGSITIKAGATVDIEPGAIVTASTGVAITVKGTLKVLAGANHAKLGGTNWKGIVVASGGTLSVDGLDISDAEIGMWTMAGNADATMLNSSIAGAKTPFQMAPGSKLSVTKTNVTKATGQSEIAGTFTASYMDYDKGTNEGLLLNDPAGTMTISDSTLRGAGGGDYVVSAAGKLVKVEYSTITGSHCGLHFGAVDKFIIDHVSDDANSYGAMLYGSGAGPNQIISSNVRSIGSGAVSLAFSGTNGVTTIDKSFMPIAPKLATNATITNAAATAIVDAKPR